MTSLTTFGHRRASVLGVLRSLTSACGYCSYSGKSKINQYHKVDLLLFAIVVSLLVGKLKEAVNNVLVFILEKFAFYAKMLQ